MKLPSKSMLLCGLALALPATAQSVVEVKRLHGNAANYYRPLNVPVGAEPTEELTLEPQYEHTPQYATLNLGDGADPLITVVIDEAADGSSSKIYIDANNNEDLTDDGAADWSAQNQSNWTRNNAAIQVDYSDGSLPYTLNFYRFKTKNKDKLFFYRATYIEGKIEAGGKKTLFRLLDDNADGRFDDAANGALFVDRNGDGVLEISGGSAESYGQGEAFDLLEKNYRLGKIAPSGATLSFEETSEKVVPKAYLIKGYPALDFKAKTIDGADISLADYKGKVVLIDFWATWCGPCIAELPKVKEVYAKHKGGNFEIIGISLDNKMTALRDFLAKNPDMTWPQICDERGWKAEIGQLYRVNSIPATFLIGPDGTIIGTNLRGEALGKAVEAALSEKK